MVTKKIAQKPIDKHPVVYNGMGLFFKRVFAMMFGAVGLTAVTSYVTLMWGLPLVFNSDYTGYSILFYVLMFGGFALSIFAQSKIFSMKPAIGGLLLAVYAVTIGFVLTPLIAVSLSINPGAILQAFIIAAIMFACMALFGYKTTKNLNFLGRFLYIGMIGLVMVGVASYILPMILGPQSSAWLQNDTFSIIVCAIGVLVFALFTAYDMQFLKNTYKEIGDENGKNQLAVLGALHLYISFVAMFQYLLGLLNRG